MTNQKRFYKKVEHLESILNKKLTVNSWSNHKSVYTEGVNGSCEKIIVNASSYREACDQLDSVFNILGIVKTNFPENPDSSKGVK